MAAAAAARPAPTPNLLVALRNLIINDQVALLGWAGVVDDIVTKPVDVLCMKSMLDDGKYAEAVLQSLQVWHSKGGERVNLLDVLKQHQFNALIAEVMGSECRCLLQETRSSSAQSRISFEVRKLIGNFTGREEELEILQKLLTELHSRDSFDRNVVSISGLGGIGKSTLARKYALTYKDFYDGNIIWIDAQSLDSMRASFIRLSTRLGLQGGDKLSNEELAARVFEYFEDKKCLFIFDNIEDLDHFKQFEPAVENSDHEAPYVLLTSREIGLTSLPDNEMHLDVLKIEEAVKLIRVYLPKSTDENVVKLAEALQRLPLALQQALAYIRFVYIKNSAEDDLIVKYLKDFEKSKADLLKDEKFKKHNDYSKTTFATWQITLTKIKEISNGASAIGLINVLAYLNPNMISVQFVGIVFEAETEPGLKLLERFSMINTGDDGRITIHRLVQEVIRLNLSGQEEGKVVLLVTSAIYEELKKRQFTGLVRECTSHGVVIFPFQVSHFESVLERPDYFSRLRYFLLSYRNYEENFSIAQKASSLYESINGPDHESTLTMKWAMAESYNFFNNYAEAKLLLNSILSTAKSKLGEQHDLTWNILSTYADVSNRSEDHERAVEIYEEIIPLAERKHGEDNHNVLCFKYSKAIALSNLKTANRLDESMELFLHVYEKQSAQYGKSDDRTLRTRFQIGHVHFLRGEYPETIQVWEEVGEDLKEKHGETDPFTKFVHGKVAQVKQFVDER